MGYFATGKQTQLLNIYENKPKEESIPFPTIILFTHVHGIDDPMKKVVDDLASAGYYGIAVDPYLNGSYNPHIKRRSDKGIFNNYEILIEWLKANKDVNMDKLGGIGFCMGGRHVYLINANYDYFRAVVSFYGFPHRGNETEDKESFPQNRIDDFTGATLGIFGGKDKGIPKEAVDAYKEASERDGKPHKTLYYEEAEHGFLDPFSKRYHQESAEKAWKETIDFFDKYLK